MMWCRREFVITIPVRLATTCGDTGNTLAAYLSLPAFKLRLVTRGGGGGAAAARFFCDADFSARTRGNWAYGIGQE